MNSYACTATALTGVQTLRIPTTLLRLLGLNVA